MLLIEITFLFDQETQFIKHYNNEKIISIVLFLCLEIHNFVLLKKH